MAIKAVVFDIGGVLERVGDESWLSDWKDPSMSAQEFDAAMAAVDPDGMIEVGAMGEAEYLQRFVDALGLSPERAGEFAAAMWDWYCGELDHTMCDYAASLRPRYTTAILSNSADGARREEQSRWAFEQLVDVVIYSHEVGLAKPDPRIFQLACDRLEASPSELVFVDDTEPIVDSAQQLGIHAVLHRDSAQTIRAVEALLGTYG
jgi:epoxide hydrolase-like predicted phosphatase